MRFSNGIFDHPLSAEFVFAGSFLFSFLFLLFRRGEKHLWRNLRKGVWFYTAPLSLFSDSQVSLSRRLVEYFKCKNEGVVDDGESGIRKVVRKNYERIGSFQGKGKERGGMSENGARREGWDGVG